MKIVILIISSLFCQGQGSIANRNEVNADKEYQLETNRIPKVDTDRKIRVGTVQNVGFGTCVECKLAVDELVNLLKEPQYQKSLKDYLERTCALALTASECNTFIDENFEALLHEILPVLENSEAVCQKMGMCGADASTSLIPQLKLKYLKNQVLQIRGASNSLCDDCELAMNGLKEVVEDKELQDEVRKQLEDLCVNAQTFKDECKSLVDQYYPQLISALKKYLANAEQLCTDIGLCGSRNITQRLLEMQTELDTVKTPQIPILLRTVPVLGTSSGISASCAACEATVGEIIDYLENNNDTIHEMIEGAEELCDALPTDLSSKCDKIVERYGKTALKLLWSEVTPQEVCKVVRLCSEMDVSFIHALSTNDLKNVECDACNTLFTFLQAEMRDTVIQNELAQLMDKACNLVGNREYINDCKQGVQTYVPQMMTILSGYMTPGTMCPAIGMC